MINFIKTVFLVFVICAFVPLQSLQAQVSTFDDPAVGVDGWTVTQDGTVDGTVYQSSGGASGGDTDGFIQATDNTIGPNVWYWEAPSEFLGNKKDFYHGSLHFDIRYDSSGAVFSACDFVLEGAGMELCRNLWFDPRAPAEDLWVSADVPLTEAGWVFIGTTNAPTPQNMLDVLGDITELRIRGEFTGGATADIGGLDNVELFIPVVAPPDADISIAITELTDDPVEPGQQITYIITVTNSPTSSIAATNVTVELVDIDPPLNNVFNPCPCSLTGELQAGDSWEFPITGTAVTIGDTKINGTVSSDGPDSDLANNTAEEFTAVAWPDVDLSITITELHADPIPFGTTLLYSIEVTNESAATATNVRVDTNINPSLNDVYNPCPCSINVLAPGASWVFVTGGNVVFNGEIVEFNALVSSNNLDTDSENDNATEFTSTGPPQADLSISITELSGDPVEPGQQLVYRMTVTNSSPFSATATNVMINPIIDPSLNNPVFPSSITVIGQGESKSRTLSGTVAVTHGVITITASVTSGDVPDDPNPVNNTAVEVTSVGPPSRPWWRKWLSPLVGVSDRHKLE